MNSAHAFRATKTNLVLISFHDDPITTQASSVHTIKIHQRHADARFQLYNESFAKPDKTLCHEHLLSLFLLVLFRIPVKSPV